MTDRRSPEPFVWLLFSGGGMAAALVVPVLLALFGVLIPLGWVTAPDHTSVLGLVRHPITLLVLFGLCALALFHWAHRFRFTVQHGLSLRRGHVALELLCYGAAAIGCVIAAVVLTGIR